MASILLILLTLLPVAAMADSGEGGDETMSLACSTAQSGKAVINEVNTQADFVEIYLLQPANIKNWALYADGEKIKTLGVGSCKINGMTMADNSGGVTTYPAGTFVYCAYEFNASKGQVLLVDKNTSLSSGNATVIDFLSYGSPEIRWTVPSACGTVYPDHNANNKDIARIPDGTGGLTDNGTASTPGTTNGSPVVIIPATNPANFTCVEAGGDAATGSLYTKLAGTAFSGFDVVALKSDGSVQTAYAGTGNKSVTVELVDGSGSTACASRAALSPAVSQTVTFAAADHGRKTMSAASVANAYRNIRCRVTDANQSPSIIGCSADSFAVRPTVLTLASTGANADSAGSSASALPVVKAGTAFSLTATATPGYDGTPSIDQTKLLAHSGAVQVGSLTGTFTAAVAATGIAAGNGFAYSEVGYFALGADGVYDDSFTSVDSANGDCTADFSNTNVGGMVGCKFGNSAQTSYFGRFIPGHLQAQVLGNGSFAHACSTFSYNGQAISYGTSNHPMLDVNAYNASSPSTVTKNYTGKFARLQAGQFSFTAPTTDAAKKGADGSNLVKLTANLGTPSLTDNGNGNLTLVLGNDSFTYQREANALIAPFSNDVAITVSSVTDSDGVTASGLPIALHPAGENIRYGRINLMNAFGSELADLAVPMTAEYFDGKSFITSADDHCSVATIGFSNPIAMGVADTCIWDNGGLSGSTKCGGSAPSGESYLEGSSLVSGNFNLYLKAPNKTGSLTVNATVDNWMKFNWTGAGVANPTTTATFGVYKGNSKQIYLRELY